MRKYICIGIVAILAIIALAFPYNVGKAKAEFNDFENTLREYRNTKNSKDSAINALNSAKTSFDSERTFEVYYGDIERIQTILDKVTSVSTLSITAYDVVGMSGESTYTDGMSTPAVRLVIATDDMNNGFNIINRLELPIYSIKATEPNIIEVIFLTGGSIE